MNYIVIDQGTSSTKAFLFNAHGQFLHTNKIKHELYRPKQFHVESDPSIILNAIKLLFQEMVRTSGKTKIHRAGMAVQRSTFLFWEKKTCKPVTPALSWQDSRAYGIAEEFKEFGEKLWEITGTPLSAHFGGPKFLHLIRKDQALKRRINNGDLYFGPLSAFLSQAITGLPGIDDSIACRSLFYNISKRKWSAFALDLFQVPQTCLPPLVPIKKNYGTLFETDIPLSIIIGDQQAALIGQGGLKTGSMGANFGTSGSIQYNAGRKPFIIKGLISSVLYSDEEKRMFMVEGTINACNALFYHLENMLSIPHKEMNWDKRARSTDTDGIYIPGFSGLSAPYWTTGFEDIFIGLKDDPDQIVRAAVESIGFLVNDILECLKPAVATLPNMLTAAGGGARPSLLQFIANVTGMRIGYSSIKDRTALGVFRILNDSYMGENSNQVDTVFYPEQSANIIEKKAQWRKAIGKANLN